MNKIFGILREGNFWLQLMVWVALFMMPFTFIRPMQDVTFGRFLLLSTHPCAILIVYYVNCYWLFPNYLKGKHRQFWISNAVMVVAFSLMVHLSMDYMWKHDNPVRKERRFDHEHPNFKGKKKNHLHDRAMMMFRDSFNLVAAIIVASSVITTRRLNEAEKARRDAEISNLRSQINPHFLLNTLNNIYALTAFDTGKAQKAILELSKMFRHVLYDNQKPFVRLSDEVAFLKNYIELMRLRLPGHVRLDAMYHVPDNVDVQVAPMLFISLIENAFKHGVSQVDDSFISIDISADERKICCEIRNSNNPKNDSDRSGHGVGLVQVEKRLELMYHGAYEWDKGIDKDNNVYYSKLVIYDTKLCNC